MSRGDSKADRMLRAARVFVRGGSWEEAARAAGVSKQSVSRYRQDPEWPAVLEQAEAEAPVIQLVPPDANVDELAANWKLASSLTLAMAAQPAARLMADAMTGTDVTKAQLDTARWILERMGVAAPEEEPPAELTTHDEVAEALAEEVDPRILREALRLAEGGD